MQATYATILIVSSLTAPEPQHYVAQAFNDVWQCSEALGLLHDVWRENDMMARCIETRIVTSTSPPVPRPEGLTDE